MTVFIFYWNVDNLVLFDHNNNLTEKIFLNFFRQSYKMKFFVTYNKTLPFLKKLTDP